MPKPATLLALLCLLAACGSDTKGNPQTTGKHGVESGPSERSTTGPAAETPTPTSPETAAAAMTPADTNTTLPAATPEEAAPPPEP